MRIVFDSFSQISDVNSRFRVLRLRICNWIRKKNTFFGREKIVTIQPFSVHSVKCELLSNNNNSSGFESELNGSVNVRAVQNDIIFFPILSVKLCCNTFLWRQRTIVNKKEKNLFFSHSSVKKCECIFLFLRNFSLFFFISPPWLCEIWMPWCIAVQFIVLLIQSSEFQCVADLLFLFFAFLHITTFNEPAKNGDTITIIIIIRGKRNKIQNKSTY